MTPVLQITDLSYTYPGNDAPAIQLVSLLVNPGECVCITGPSGCGKTTLLLAVQGLLKEGHLAGTIQAGEGGITGNLGMVFQNADTQILCTTVEDEVGFGPRNLGLSPGEASRNVERALNSVGLSSLCRRNVEQLSAGEKHRLTIASVLSMRPSVLLLDEPVGQLDAPGKARLVEVLSELKSRGHALLIADHDLVPFLPIADRWFLMRDGCLEETDEEFATQKTLEGNRSRSYVSNGSDEFAVLVDGLSLCGLGERYIFEEASLTVRKGERVHLQGLNGAGKSTLLRCMIGFEKAEASRLRIVGLDSPRPEGLVGKVGMLFQNPEKQLFADSVYEEVSYCLRKLHLSPQQKEQYVKDSLEQCGISHLARRSPLTLSYGEQHRVALASVIASRPDLLLLDEPFSGLDFEMRVAVLDVLSRLNSSLDMSILFASHDPPLDPQWADRHVILKDGKIENA